LVWVPSTFAAPPAPGYGHHHDWGGGGFWHQVAWGESLSSIGWAFGVNPFSICTANGLANCNFVWAGQRLWIPAGHGGGPVCAAYHTVSWGQTLSGIAAWFGVSPWHLARANGIQNPNQIYAEQTLCIPGR
jgi:LysM repeat protein